MTDAAPEAYVLLWVLAMVLLWGVVLLAAAVVAGVVP